MLAEDQLNFPGREQVLLGAYRRGAGVARFVRVLLPKLDTSPTGLLKIEIKFDFQVCCSQFFSFNYQALDSKHTQSTARQIAGGD
ncbi:MAG: hypothetical protein ACR2G4_07140 [Pyrinomonadaceae bacterium]